MKRPKRLTPAMAHYLKEKQKHPDAILMYRMGDFYEMFFEDAVQASKELEITLTARDRDENGDGIPMCGVPYHAIEPYIQKLLDRGRKVAICEQIEDPKASKGLVKRAVTRVLTPGIQLAPDKMDPRLSHWIASAVMDDKACGLAAMDFSTGEFIAMEPAGNKALVDELTRLNVVELILPDSIPLESLGLDCTSKAYIQRLPESAFAQDRAIDELLEHFSASSIEALGFGKRLAAARAAGALLRHVRETQAGIREPDLSRASRPNGKGLKAPDVMGKIWGAGLDHIKDIRFLDLSSRLGLDESTLINLEITRTIRESSRKGSLLDVIDETVTSAGSRMLANWLTHPLKDVDPVNSRLDAVDAFVGAPMIAEKIRKLFDRVTDLSRLAGKVAVGTINPRDMVALAATLEAVPHIKETLDGLTAKELTDIAMRLLPMDELKALIRSAIKDDPPATLKDGGVIRTGYNSQLDELRNIATDSKSVIMQIEQRERKRTGINSLKVGYNRIFGYYIEVPRSRVSAVPEGYVRKQTLVNAERYIMEELKEYEDKVLGSEERIIEIEHELFKSLRSEVLKCMDGLKLNAHLLAKLDVFAGLAHTARKLDYIRPKVTDEEAIDIRGGRHPVVERMTSLKERFVPNDSLMDRTDNRLLIITGPNMAGKSTLMRQVALIVIMAQAGSFVPAESAAIGIVDKIFTRVGAADSIARGMSTFMVEMTETANILRSATSRSLVILDEIGRGTSTFDGLSIAWAVAEALHDDTGCRTMFATHYHELTDLAQTRDGVKNYNVAVKEWEGKIIFLRRLVKGGTSRSYGIQVARLAGVPNDVIERAREVLKNLEDGEYSEGLPRLATSQKGDQPGGRQQLDIFSSATPSPIIEELNNIEPDTLTPLEALNLLDALKKKYT